MLLSFANIHSPVNADALTGMAWLQRLQADGVKGK
jgi:hypothetical protein